MAAMLRYLPFALTLTACSATMVNAPGSTSTPNAPVNETTRPGLVKYLADGAGFVVDARRRDAYEQMKAACGGPYRIDAEGPNVEGGVVVANALLPSTYWYIQFSCVGAAAAR